MLVMTAKVDKKKIAVILAVVLVAIAGLVLLFGGSDSQPTVSTGVSNNDERVAFLKSFGWEVTTSPVESSQVKIPEKASEVYDRYNELQKSQGYDLTQYAGKTVMRYVYQINVLKQQLVLSDYDHFAFQVNISKEALRKMKELMLFAKV